METQRPIKGRFPNRGAKHFALFTENRGQRKVDLCFLYYQAVGKSNPGPRKVFGAKPAPLLLSAISRFTVITVPRHVNHININELMIEKRLSKYRVSKNSSIPYMTSRPAFDLFISGVCRKPKEPGDIDFLIDIIEILKADNVDDVLRHLRGRKSRDGSGA